MGDVRMVDSKGYKILPFFPTNTTTTTTTTTTISPENQTICHNDYCISNEDYVDMIQEFIYPTKYEWVIISLYIIVFIVGAIGNFLVCFAVWRNQHMHTVTNYFIVNLAVADLMVILICLPPTVLGDVTETWYIGSVMCKIVMYSQGVSVSVSVLTLCAISIERWYAICYPLEFKSTSHRARVMMIIIWFLGLTFMIPDLVVLDTHERFENLTILLTTCKPTWAYQSQTTYELVKLLALYCLPFFLMGYTYKRIIQTLWSNTIPTETNRSLLHNNGCQHSTSKRHRPVHAVRTSAENQLIARRKAARMLIAVVAMFGICYLPVHLLNILRYAKVLPEDQTIVYFALTAHWLCYFNSAINPVMYNFMSEKFHKAFRNACPCRCCVGKHDLTARSMIRMSERRTTNSTFV